MPSPTIFPDTTLTSDAYWLSKPPDVRALHTGTFVGASRIAAAMALAASGHIIDFMIDAVGYDPVWANEARRYYGYTWVPALGQPALNGVPGIQGTVYDPLHPPAGSIRVSTNIADYPPFDPPAPVVQPSTNAVDVSMAYPWNGGTTFAPGPGAKYKDSDKRYPDYDNGQTVTQDGKSYKVRTIPWMFGVQLWFDPIS